MAAAAPLRVHSIALVSPLNHPIIVRSFAPNDEMKANYIAHTSLDVFEERVALGPKLVDCYLGHLYSMDDLAVYGYITPTRIKIIIALELADAVVRDAEVVTIFKAVHAAYHDSLSNPFIRLDYSSSETAETDASSLLVMGSKSWNSLKRRIDGVGRAVGSLPPLPTSRT